jgi:hypothetical protein
VQAEGEVKYIQDIMDIHTIVLNEPIGTGVTGPTGYPLENSYVEKLMEGTFLEAVYLGDPPVIPRYPAITINAKSKNNEWLTLESTKATYNIDITVLVDAADYEKALRLMHYYAHQIENSLWRSLYPLAQPYLSFSLLNDIQQGDYILRVDDSVNTFGLCNFAFLESFDYLRPVKIVESLGNGVYKTAWPIERPFSAGDHVIRPGRHIFNSRPASIQYGTINADTMLKAAVISYMAEEEVKRYVPFVDPLTF